MKKRILAVVLCLSVTFLSVVGCNNKNDKLSNPSGTAVSSTLEFQPLSAGQERTHSNKNAINLMAGRTNDILLYGNPDRGYRTTLPVLIYDEHPDPDDPTKTTDTCDYVYRDEKGNVQYNPNSKCKGKHQIDVFYANWTKADVEELMDYLCDKVYFRLDKTGYQSKLILLQGELMSYGKVEVLPQEVFDIFDIFFDRCRQKECKVLFRYGYHILQLNWQLNEENRLAHEAVGASEEIMLKHIDQFAPFITKNIDVIHKWSSGVIGSGGEMAYAYQYPVVDYDNIIKAIVEKVCVPNNIYYTSRSPVYKLNLLENDPDYPYASYIGFNNDAVFGETDKYGWDTGCFQYNHNFEATKFGMCFHADHGGQHIPNDWWNYVCQEAAYTPQSGEMYHNLAWNADPKIPSGMEMINQLAHHRYTTLSHWNSYIEASFKNETTEDGKKIPGDSVMQRWIDNELVTPELLDEAGIIYDPAWFYDEEGNMVERNPYEFIRDHLGYKVVAQKAALNGSIGKNCSLSVNLTLKNYGFAAAFNIESGYMVLDKDYNVVSEVKAGEPEKWYSHDPENWKSTEVLEHTVTADITLPSEKGKYYLAFYMRNTMEDYAKLSNNMDYISDKYNILYELEI